jgi:large repetitive protein
LNLTLTATSIESSTGIISTALTHNFSVNIDAIKLTDAAGTATHDYIGGDAAANTLGGAAGTDGDDILDGLAGNDTLNGGNGNDKLLGGLGNDILNGGAGFDILSGGKGNDTMTGGTGRDTFKWLAADKGLVGTPAADIITDFASGVSGDVIDLRSLLQGATPGHYQDFININVVAGTTTLRISSTGGYGAGYNAAATDQTIQLTGVDVTTGNNGFLINSLNDLVTNGNLLVL